VRACIALTLLGLTLSACSAKQPTAVSPPDPQPQTATAPAPSASAAPPLASGAPKATGCPALTPRLVFAGASGLECVQSGPEKLRFEAHWAAPDGTLGVLLLRSDEGHWTAFASDGTRVWTLVEKFGRGDDALQVLELQSETGSPRLVASRGEAGELHYGLDAKRERFVLVGPGPLVMFDAAAEGKNENGDPSWTLEVAGFPALHQSGKKVAVTWHEDHGLATSLNLHVDVLDAITGNLLQRHDVLSEQELRVSTRLPSPKARELAHKTLEKRVNGRIAAVNAALDPATWKELDRCPGPLPSDWDALPTGHLQTGVCGELSYSYERGAVHLEKQGRVVDRRFPQLRGGKTPTGDEWIDVVTAAYTDPDESLLLLHVIYGASGGGDAHGLTARWQVVRAP
jgi:hypothetical protein